MLLAEGLTYIRCSVDVSCHCCCENRPPVGISWVAVTPPEGNAHERALSTCLRGRGCLLTAGCVGVPLAPWTCPCPAAVRRGVCRVWGGEVGGGGMGEWGGPEARWL